VAYAQPQQQSARQGFPSDGRLRAETIGKKVLVRGVSPALFAFLEQRGVNHFGAWVELSGLMTVADDALDMNPELLKEYVAALQAASEHMSQADKMVAELVRARYQEPQSRWWLTRLAEGRYPRLAAAAKKLEHSASPARGDVGSWGVLVAVLFGYLILVSAFADRY